jgi:hypothetical protein
MIDISLLQNEFARINKLGFVKCTRPNNSDGGIGNTFEDYLDVKENNLKEPDFNGFEIKSQRDFTSSYVSLFTKRPMISHAECCLCLTNDLAAQLKKVACEYTSNSRETKRLLILSNFCNKSLIFLKY